MKKLLSLLLILPLLVYCKPDNPEGNDPEQQEQQQNQDPNQQQQQQQQQQNQEEPDLPTEIHDGDVILATNRNVQKFLEEVTYPDRDYSYTKVLEYYGGANGKKYNENGEPDENGTTVSNPKSDRPEEYTIRWTADPASVDLNFHLEEPTWSRDQVVSSNDGYVTITNLMPNTTYKYKISYASDGKVVTEGSFSTTGLLHQVFFRSSCRNARDLGGWKTYDGKTTKYRKIYRGGRMQSSTVNSRGKKEIQAEGICAQLDLRGKSDVLSKPAIDGFDFCAPIIEEGGTTMLQKDAEKTKQCFDFVLNCVRENKPVYFHCSLGRDRTGTLGILLLGVLGVIEGDISKEYEVTYFAPRGWSIAESETYTTFQNTRTKWAYKPVAEFFWSKAGEGGTFAQGVENYLLEIGVPQTDIDDFRSLMLED